MNYAFKFCEIKVSNKKKFYYDIYMDISEVEDTYMRVNLTPSTPLIREVYWFKYGVTYKGILYSSIADLVLNEIQKEYAASTYKIEQYDRDSCLMYVSL